MYSKPRETKQRILESVSVVLPAVRQSDCVCSISAYTADDPPGGGHARRAAEDEEGEERAPEGPAGDFSARCSATWQPRREGDRY